MTKAAAAAALDRIETDEAFATRLKDGGNPEADLAILQGEGFDVTQQDMRDAVLDRYGEELTPEQLEALTAGLDPVVEGAIVGASTTVVVTAAALAAVV
jgi:predicted ribosomally synthesized peptide with nif11-like leader